MRIIVYSIMLFVCFQSIAIADSIVKPKPRAVRIETTIKRDTAKKYNNPAIRIKRDTVGRNNFLPKDNLLASSVDSIQLAKDSLAKIDSLNKAINDSLLLAAQRVIKRPVLPLPPINTIKFRAIKENRWLFLIGFILLLLIGLNRILNIKRYDKLLWGSLSGAPIKSNEAVYKELSIHQILSIVIIALTFAIGIHLMMPFPFDNVFKSGLSKYFFIFSVLIFVYGLKAFFYHLVLTILQVRETPNLLYSQFIMITYALAVAILPLVLVYYYSPFEIIKPYLIYASLILAIVFFVIRLIRTTIAFAAIFPYSIFYLFIYLCTLEIIPWMLIFQGYRFGVH